MFKTFFADVSIANFLGIVNVVVLSSLFNYKIKFYFSVP